MAYKELEAIILIGAAKARKRYDVAMIDMQVIDNAKKLIPFKHLQDLTGIYLTFLGYRAVVINKPLLPVATDFCFDFQSFDASPDTIRKGFASKVYRAKKLGTVNRTKGRRV